MEAYKTFKEKNGERILKILYDESPESPREWDNLGTMICFHSKYGLGDKHDLTQEMFDSWEAMETHIWDELDAAVVLPLYLYDHSGITISTAPFSCPWDSMRVGFIYVSKERLKEEKLKEEDAKRILKGEVETYDQFLRGDVYRFEMVKEVKCEA